MLSSLKPELDKKGVALVGVVHETIGVEEFKPFFKGKIYLDEKVGLTLSTGIYISVCSDFKFKTAILCYFVVYFRIRKCCHTRKCRGMSFS